MILKDEEAADDWFMENYLEHLTCLEELPWFDLADLADVFEPEETKRLKTLREFEAEWKVQPHHSLIEALALETLDTETAFPQQPRRFRQIKARSCVF